MADDFSTVAKDAVTPLVAALDVGSTGTRGCLFDARGLPVHGTKLKVEHQFTTGADGTSTIDPDQVVAEALQCLEKICDKAPGEVAGVAIDTFAASLVGTDGTGKALTPCYTYADSRPQAQLAQLRGELDEDEVQQRTGTRQHTSYLPARFRWLAETDKSTVAKVRHWMSLGEYVWQQLLGATAAGTSTAAWTGMLDRHEGTWDTQMLQLAGVEESLLSEVRNPDRPLEARSPSSALGKLKPLAKAQWFPPITDGFAQSLGVAGHDGSKVVLSAATSGALRILVDGDLPTLPRGLWCYRVDASRSILGGALSDVGRAFSWLGATLQLPGADELDGVLRAAPDEATPLVMPWFSGERSTGWAGGARAVFQGVSAATGPSDLYRGTAEGVAIAYLRILTEIVHAAGKPSGILATGRVVEGIPALLPLLADVLQVPVTPVVIDRSTLHGTAVSALEVLAPKQERTVPTRGQTVEPDASRHVHYQRRAEAFGVLYGKVIAHV